MPREIVEPMTKDSNSPVSETVTAHPAYAQICAYRVSGSANLYDSDFRHQHYMTIKICRSELHRSLNRDWHFGKEDIIEVALSEAQWATFVSSPGMGDGVPCTMERLHGKMIPGLPAPASRVDQFASEVKQKMERCVGLIDRALNEIAATGLSKAKQESLAGAIRAARMELGANLPFVAEQFSEHMENTVEKAKQEVHGYMVNAIQRAGLEALAGGKLPLQIEQARIDTCDAAHTANSKT